MILTSKYEAHPMVANEGLILHKPVITTWYPSASEVVTDQVNGLICQNNSEAISETICKVLKDKELFARLKKNAGEFTYENGKIVEQVVHVCENA